MEIRPHTRLRSYKADFQSQYKQYDLYRELVMQAPASAPSDQVVSLRDSIDFIAHVAHCYPDVTRDFAQNLATLLTQHHGELDAELREKIVGSYVLLRKKDIIDSST